MALDCRRSRNDKDSTNTPPATRASSHGLLSPAAVAKMQHSHGRQLKPRGTYWEFTTEGMVRRLLVRSKASPKVFSRHTVSLWDPTIRVPDCPLSTSYSLRLTILDMVWFQNRYIKRPSRSPTASLTLARHAKIKRLNADDRDRMIKMRAVPDNFDNVQALHSPYGAVYGLGTPMPSPGDLGAQSYAQHMIRPLIVDVRRVAPNDHPSPTSLTPGFGGLGFGPAGGISNPDMMSPISPAPNDRYPYGSHFSAPMNSSARTSNLFGSQNGLESSMEAN
ncbi:Homeobox-leucine zipper protein ROC3 [Ilyonectria robusta]